jgi:hypothetical protein
MVTPSPQPKIVNIYIYIYICIYVYILRAEYEENIVCYKSQGVKSQVVMLHNVIYMNI